MASRFFKKLGQGARNFFSKVGQTLPQIANKISPVLGTISNVISNPAVEAGASALLGPEVAPIMQIAGRGLQATSDLTNTSNYKGNATTVTQNILEKAKNLKDAGQDAVNLAKSNSQPSVSFE